MVQSGIQKPNSVGNKIKFFKEIKRFNWSIAFILPAFIFYILIIIFPLTETIRISLFDWDGLSAEMDFVGLANYITIMTESRFLWSLGRTVLWWGLHAGMAAGGGLIVALLISQVKWGQSIFRTLVFLPYVLSLSVVGIIWGQMYHPTIGFVNNMLEAIGLGVLTNSWLGDQMLALPAIGVASSWQAYGFYMVIFLAGLQSINPQLYEAAMIDGASPRQRFWYVTLPSLRNTMTLVLSLAFINALKGFGTIWAMTQGGPANSTELVSVYIWRLAFQNSEFSIASTAAFVLGVCQPRGRWR